MTNVPSGQEFKARIGAVGSEVVVHEPDVVLSLATIEDVFISTYPSDPVASRRALVRHVAERDETIIPFYRD